MLPLVEGGNYPIVFVSLKPIDGVRDTHALVITETGELNVTVYDPLRGERILPKQTFSTAWAIRHNLTIIIIREQVFTDYEEARLWLMGSRD